MVLRVKSINLDGLVHTNSCEKFVSETASQGLETISDLTTLKAFRICSVELLLNKLPLLRPEI